MENKYFKLYAHCIPVRGFLRSSICDLQREDIYYVPNEIADILLQKEQVTLTELFTANAHQHDLLNEYLNYLLEHQLGFITPTPDRFPEMDMQWDDPSYINNAIVDIDDKHDVNFTDTFNGLRKVGCRNVQVRFFRTSTPEELTGMLELLDRTLFKSIEIIVGYSESIEDDFYQYLIANYKRIKSIFIHSSPTTYIYRIVDKEIGYGTNMGNIIFTEQVIDSNACCGVITPLSFAVNIKTFTEAQHFNSCLNRKVGIDTNGDIKNCPSGKNVYGNIYKDDLELTLKNSPDYEAMWHLKKNDFKACRDCEHRFVCVDCRMFLADPDDKLSKPLKCSYDPYSAQWESERGTNEMFGYDAIEPFNQPIAG
jgi:SPASM domain peptide maturase of grasp-with-spasm system